MAYNAGEPLVNQHVQRKIVRVVVDNATGTFTIDAALTDPALLGKVEVVTSAIAGTLLTEQTFTGANATTAIGLGLLDGLAIGPVTGMVVSYITASGVPLIGKVTTIAGQAVLGITTSKNVAVLSGFGASIAGAAGKVHFLLEYV
jgi:uncharacterized membrane protein (DUF441 family)